MIHTLKSFYFMGVLLGLLFLSACGTATPTITPTIDFNPIRTEAAATVLAQVSQTLAAKPSATPAPSATATMSFTSTPTQVSSVSPSPAVTLSTGTPGAGADNRSEWVSQSIADGTILAPGQTFTVTFRLKNAGSSIWTAAFMLRFYSGEPFGAPTEVLLGRIVLPNETVDISIPMRAPVQVGEYRTDWVMANESRSNFKEPVFLKITVAAPPTPTPAATSTSAP